MLLAHLTIGLLAFTSQAPHQPALRTRAKGAIATARDAGALNDIETPLVAPNLQAAAQPEEMGEQRLSTFLGIPTMIPSIALAAAFAVWATRALGTTTGLYSVKLIFAGAVAGVISRTACAPLEMVSTLMSERRTAQHPATAAAAPQLFSLTALAPVDSRSMLHCSVPRQRKQWYGGRAAEGLE